ncbi:MAG: sulfatase-like hydrolase/transferase [Chloroflexia bacterium]|nr:sulfatase-like hydrolase/transferase [Chloroflexia bacterium]
MFLTDQQRWDTTGSNGNPIDLTPNLDRFARRNTHVPLAFTPQPVCGPARSCLQTGMWATETGCFCNDIPLPPGPTTLAREFGAVGYATGYIGKWHLASQEPVPPGQRGGYRSWLAANILEFTSGPYRTTLYDEANEPVRLPGYRVDALTDAAIRFIDRHRDTPFFLFLSHLEPHHQNQTDDYPPPDGYRERYQGRWVPPDLAALGGTTHQHLGGYYGQVKRLDEAFGRLLDALKSLGLDDDTVVVFTSDHGCHFKTRNAEYKRSPHDASIHVPFAIGGPGFVGGGEVSGLVSLLDLPPTLLDAAGLSIPEQMRGRSLLPLARGDRTGWPDDVFVQISESGVARAIRTTRWKYAATAPGIDSWQAPGADRYVETHLYDLECDPYELANLAGLASHRELSASLAERLIARMVAAGESAPVIEPAPTITIGQRQVDAVGPIA